MRTWKWICILIGTLASFVAELVIEHHAEHWWSSIPGFYLIFGFAGCAVIIFLSKALGKFLLQRPEDYYDGR